MITPQAPRRGDGEAARRHRHPRLERRAPESRGARRAHARRVRPHEGRIASDRGRLNRGGLKRTLTTPHSSESPRYASRATTRGRSRCMRLAMESRRIAVLVVFVAGSCSRRVEQRDPITAAPAGSAAAASAVAAHTSEPILHASDLNLVSPLRVDPTRESETRKDYDDGGVRITYQYRFDASDGVLVNSEAVIHPDAAEAHSTYDEVLASFDAQKLERDARKSFGDESASWVVLQGEQRVGHAFLIRIGTRTMYCLFSGYYFDGPDRYLALIEPKVQALATWTPVPQHAR